MTNQIVLRDVARIILPFSLFVGFFGHGAVSAAGFGVCAVCAWYEVARGWPRRAPSVNELESA